jgi:hypothetical protein
MAFDDPNLFVLAVNELMGGAGGMFLSLLPLTAAEPLIGGAGCGLVCAIANEGIFAATNANEQKTTVDFIMAGGQPIEY